MFGPTMRATFDRAHGDGPIELELSYPRDEDQAARRYAEWFGDSEVRRCLSRLYPITLSSEQEWMRKMTSDQNNIGWMIYVNGTYSRRERGEQTGADEGRLRRDRRLPQGALGPRAVARPLDLRAAS